MSGSQGWCSRGYDMERLRRLGKSITRANRISIRVRKRGSHSPVARGALAVGERSAPVHKYRAYLRDSFEHQYLLE